MSTLSAWSMSRAVSGSAVASVSWPSLFSRTQVSSSCSGSLSRTRTVAMTTSLLSPPEMLASGRVPCHWAVEFPTQGHTPNPAAAGSRPGPCTEPVARACERRHRPDIDRRHPSYRTEIEHGQSGEGALQQRAVPALPSDRGRSQLGPARAPEARVPGRGELLLLRVLEPALPAADLLPDGRQLLPGHAPGAVRAPLAQPAGRLDRARPRRPRRLQIPGLARWRRRRPGPAPGLEPLAPAS